MPARRIYREELETAVADENVCEAAHRMRERRVGALIIVDEGRHPVGILTDRDLALRVLGEKRDAAATRVADVMTPQPAVVSEDTSIEAALALMGTRPRRFRRLPVIDRDGRLTGVFTVDDALARIAGQLGSIDRVIRGQTPFIMDGL
ncbi:MAG TPA: CBS domain-containing protein, partial [Myxococcota bacterium]